jgi:hypothetical protein
MDDRISETAGPHDEIERLEERIELLAGRIENCRKIMLASRVAVALGAVILAGLIFGAIRSDPLALTVAIVAVLGGFVMLGSNRSTANEAAAELTAVEAERAGLIGSIELRVVDGGDTLH